jgi:hypothetical protein
MRRAAALLILFCSPALAQMPQTEDGARPGNIIGTGMSLPRSNAASNLNAATTHSDLAPNLPAPDADTLPGLLATARQDLATQQTGAAQEALERAETRALDRSIPAGTQNIPDDGRMVARISQARQELAAGNLRGAIQIIDSIMLR